MKLHWPNQNISGLSNHENAAFLPGRGARVGGCLLAPQHPCTRPRGQGEDGRGGVLSPPAFVSNTGMFKRKLVKLGPGGTASWDHIPFAFPGA